MLHLGRLHWYNRKLIWSNDWFVSFNHGFRVWAGRLTFGFDPRPYANVRGPRWWYTWRWPIQCQKFSERREYFLVPGFGLRIYRMENGGPIVRFPRPVPITEEQRAMAAKILAELKSE